MKIYHLQSVNSTNDYCRELLKNEDIVFVSADHQIRGKGRNQNRWIGDYGSNVYITAGIKHSKPVTIEDAASLQGLGAIAVKRVINKISNTLQVRIKYPNDIMVLYNDSYRKISGILIENNFIGSLCQVSYLGIGINVNQKSFPVDLANTAVSLIMLNYNTTPRQVVDLLIEEIIDLLKFDLSTIRNLWIDYLKLEGKEITILGTDDTWIVKEIIADCRLLVKSKSTGDTRIIDNGESISYNYN